jgi:tetratricopeptide (TPR) repeat protein
VESACVSHPDLGWQIAAAMYGWLTRRQQRDHWIALYQRAADAAKAVGDLHGEALIIGRVSMPYSQLGMHSEAAACCHRSYELRTAIGDHLGAATAILNLGAVWNNAQNPAAAISALRRAGRMGDALPDAGYLKSLIQFNLGEAYQIAGKLPKAFSHFRQALALAEQHGTPRDAAVLRLGVAKAYRMNGQARRAIANLQAAVELARQAGDALTEAEAHEETGLAYLDDGEPAQGEPHLSRALAAYRAKGHRRTAELQALIANLDLP